MAGLFGAGFDWANPNHMLIGLGDYWDRGVDNLRVFDFLNEMSNKNRIYMVMGNHDEALLDFMNKELEIVRKMDLYDNEMDVTLTEFAHFIDKSVVPFFSEDDYQFIRDEIKAKHPDLLPLLRKMQGGFKLDNYVLTHSGLSQTEKGVLLHSFADTEKFIKDFDDGSGNEYIFGHVPTSFLYKKFYNEEADGIFKYKNFIGIDNGAVFGYDLIVYVIETKSVPTIL